MAAIMDGEGGIIGQFPLEQWFLELPPCTRWWTTATVITSILVQCRIITPFQLFYSFRAVFAKSQIGFLEDLPFLSRSTTDLNDSTNFNDGGTCYHSWILPADRASKYWRLLTTFIYLGPLNIDLLFHVYFLQRYSRLLEASSPGRSAAHFAWLLLYCVISLLSLAPVLSLPFLGTSLSSTLVYIWSRRNPDVRLSFLGLVTFTAPYLPWVLMAFSLLVHGSVPKDDISGVIVGHVWYFFNDVYPSLHAGQRPFDPPMWWRRLFEGRPTQTDATNIDNDIAAVAAPEEYRDKLADLELSEHEDGVFLLV